MLVAAVRCGVQHQRVVALAEDRLTGAMPFSSGLDGGIDVLQNIARVVPRSEPPSREFHVAYLSLIHI